MVEQCPQGMLCGHQVESLSRCCSQRNSDLPGPETPSSPPLKFSEEETEAPRLEVNHPRRPCQRQSHASDPGLQTLSSGLSNDATLSPAHICREAACTSTGKQRHWCPAW